MRKLKIFWQHLAAQYPRCGILLAFFLAKNATKVAEHVPSELYKAFRAKIDTSRCPAWLASDKWELYPVVLRRQVKKHQFELTPKRFRLLWALLHNAEYRKRIAPLKPQKIKIDLNQNDGYPEFPFDWVLTKHKAV